MGMCAFHYRDNTKNMKKPITYNSYNNKREMSETEVETMKVSPVGLAEHAKQLTKIELLYQLQRIAQKRLSRVFVGNM